MLQILLTYAIVEILKNRSFSVFITNFSGVYVSGVFGDYGTRVRDRLPFDNPEKPDYEYESSNCAEKLKKTCTKEHESVCACMHADCGIYRYCDWFDNICEVIKYNCNYKYEYFEVTKGMCYMVEL